MNKTYIQELNNDEIAAVSGGNARDTVRGSFVGGNGAACANSMLFWGGVGSGIGAISSGVIGFFGGAAIGGYFAGTTRICLAY